ncbi:RING-finger protein MAG2 [Coniochaeta hoffmannii]|uniref:RING-finger protein MAG2 n=1 Tax=Coniochaeta hoffmannii TaxID=91930 RepID=A0AA38RRX0_9PEZI|nr:RING-finger protein MAG2 [Coniochaeta hoffmannii]
MTSTSSSLGKPPSAPPTATHAPSSNQSPSQSNFETNRRPSNTSLSVPGGAPRKGQASRKQHRAQRRPGMPPPPSSSRGGNLDQDDALAELRAVRNPSSRRGQTSITHLLNYALPPRQVYTSQHHGHSSSRSYRRNPTWSHPADKARYVHANYRFVVNPTGNYALQASEPDEHLDWGDVLQVLASAESQQTACPICLGEPVAPRMAKCGHIFCLPCLIRFMNSHADAEGPGNGHGGGQEKKQNRWRKCPICEDTVYMSDARPVRFYAGQESPLPRPGDDVVLRLMARNAKSILALPREGGGGGGGGVEVIGPGDDVPWHFAVNVLDYARIMKGTGAYMEEQYDREIGDILTQEKEDELVFHQDNEWTQRAIRAVNAAKEKVKGLGDTSLVASTAASAATPSASQPRPQADRDFYFYMSPPHLYLSPLDIRILKTHFGSFSAFPSTLLPRVEHISTGHAVDDAVRKRAKYLGHLPQGCLISFLECDWTDIVPAEVLATFDEEIERRRRRNRDKAAQEERERLQAERIEAAAIRDSRRGVIRESRQNEEDAMTLRFGGGGDRVDLEHDFLPLGAAATTPPNPRNGFAQLADVSTSPSQARTVWGTPAIVVGEAVEEPVRHRNVDDGWLKDDEVLQTLGDADLALQMEALGVVDEGPSRPTPSGTGTSTPGGGKGKKKKQKITLMSTGGRRGN